MNVLPTRVFSREDPCTKVHLMNCFCRKGIFVSVPVVESRGLIGLNAPKYLRNCDHVTVTEVKGVEYYTLTEAGKLWLVAGLKRHLELNPDDAALVESMPGMPAKRAIRAAKPVPAPVVTRRIRRAG